MIDYRDAWARQKECVARVIQGGPEALLVGEHPAVITLGRASRAEHILAPRPELERRGIPVIEVDRGGDVTLHAPGQLVIYPVLNLKHYRRDLKFYLHQLEQSVIDFLNSFGIVACRFPSRTGVWINDKKIASIGIGVRKWVSFHGISVNITPDLRLFSLVKSCGLDAALTSVEAETGEKTGMKEAKNIFIETFIRHFSGLKGLSYA